MKGDFTRITFDPTKHYTRVLEQQGRVQVDSDFNEMAYIHQYFLRRLAADLIGPHGGPADSFKLDALKDNGKDVLLDFGIGSGHYYVDGILCEGEEPVRYTTQDTFPLSDAAKLEKGKNYVAYLDVWERHITEFEDEDENKIGIREVALRGPDTATRAKIISQIKAKELGSTKPDDLDPKTAKAYENFLKFLGDTALGSGLLRARAIKPESDDEPCLISPQARFRGAENQLYRVEIHHGGVAMPADLSNVKIDVNKIATFKWSRENGSVIFPISKVQGDIVILKTLGRDSRFGLRPDDWVEIVDDDYALQNRAEPLLQVKDVNVDNESVTLKATPASPVGTDPSKHPLLRRWDQTGSDLERGVFVVEGSGDEDSSWITLEDGVQIQFPPLPPVLATGAEPVPPYRTGDYWMIPARAATGDVEWPGPPGNPLPRLSYGVEHSYAPLAIVSIAGDGTVKVDKDLRRTITPVSS
ncbi:MAG TPA: DUF6519 domain-containing protein [Blastocatellia bacterium]|nr:DUF6519 domain-containing protein [Blastocatellia bacterium]